MRRYVGIVRKGSPGAFSIEFPDLPGCATVGKTMSDARRLAAEVLATHLQGMDDAGQPVPVARNLGSIRDDPEWRDATTLILVEAPVPKRPEG